MNRRITPLLERFYSKVDTDSDPNGHHLWTGAVDGNGYGKIWHNKRFLVAHRCALAWATGESGIGLDAAHDDSKHCPRTCVNPAHLSWKSHHDNMLDVITKHGRLGVNRKIATRALPLYDEASQ
jgi:hypothetical protein